MDQMPRTVQWRIDEADHRVAKVRDAARQNALLPRDEDVWLRSHLIYVLGSVETVFETTNVPPLIFNETLALIADIPLEICPERGRLIHCLFEIKQNKKSRFFEEQLPFPELSFVFRKLTLFSGNTPVSEEIRVFSGNQNNISGNPFVQGEIAIFS